MVERAARALALPDDWPAHPDPILALNRMGGFEWDLKAGQMTLDAQAHEVFELSEPEFDGRPESLSRGCRPWRATGSTPCSPRR